MAWLLRPFECRRGGCLDMRPQEMAAAPHPGRVIAVDLDLIDMTGTSGQPRWWLVDVDDEDLTTARWWAMAPSLLPLAGLTPAPTTRTGTCCRRPVCWDGHDGGFWRHLVDGSPCVAR